MDEIMEYFRLATCAGKLVRCFDTLKKITVVFGLTAALLGAVKTVLIIKNQKQNG